MARIMTIDPKSPAAGGGCLVFAGFILGAGFGIMIDEPSLGVIVGVASGALLALALWYAGRRRGA